MPIISVIVPVYKVEAYIHRCVDSVLNQTFSDFELILVDDGSPDNCGAICDEYAQKDPRVRVIHQKNCGLSAARNAGIDWTFANSDSQWLTFIDSDDWVHPQYLQLLYDAGIQDDTLISMCTMESVTDMIPYRPIALNSIVLSPDEAYSYKSKWPRAYACGRLYHKDCFTIHRFPVGKLWEDLFTIHKVLFEVNRISYIPTSMYYYYVNENGIVRSKWSQKKMDQLGAFEEVLVYLKDRSAVQSYPVTVRAYLSCIHLNYLGIEESSYADAEKRAYQKILQKKMAKALFRYKKVLNESFSRCVHYYEVGFPTMMKLYWYWIAIVKKIQFWK